jgi:hypothetical protein
MSGRHGHSGGRHGRQKRHSALVRRTALLRTKRFRRVDATILEGSDPGDRPRKTDVLQDDRFRCRAAGQKEAEAAGDTRGVIARVWNSVIGITVLGRWMMLAGLRVRVDRVVGMEPGADGGERDKNQRKSHERRSAATSEGNAVIRFHMQIRCN